MNRAKSSAEDPPVKLPTARNVYPFDPDPELASLREKQPLCRLSYPDGHLGWLVTGHALARAVLADHRFSMRPHRPPVGKPSNAEFFEAVEESPEASVGFLQLDPPEHTRLRRLTAGYFTVRRVNEHQAGIERIVGGRLDVMEQTGPPVDLVETFAFPIPVLTICDVLGVPYGDAERFERLTARTQDPEASAEERMGALQEFFAYASGVIKQKRRQPSDDLLSELIATGELADHELASVAVQLIAAGHETTANLLALSTFVLLYDRNRWETLRNDLSSIKKAVEELLRYATLFQVGTFTRTALEDVEMNGMLIKVGESVTVSLAAANRDPNKFPDPDRFDLSRDASGHVAFSHGVHMCLGQHLARLELQIGLAGLLQRFPKLRLAVPVEDIPLGSGEDLLFRVNELPVAW